MSSFSTTPNNFVPSAVITVTVSYSCENSFHRLEIPCAAAGSVCATDSTRYSSTAPNPSCSGPAPAVHLPLNHVTRSAARAPVKNLLPCAAFPTTCAGAFACTLGYS